VDTTVDVTQNTLGQSEVFHDCIAQSLFTREDMILERMTPRNLKHLPLPPRNASTKRNGTKRGDPKEDMKSSHA
jgi:hypothetical protein